MNISPIPFTSDLNNNVPDMLEFIIPNEPALNDFDEQAHPINPNPVLRIETDKKVTIQVDKHSNEPNSVLVTKMEVNGVNFIFSGIKAQIEIYQA